MSKFILSPTLKQQTLSWRMVGCVALVSAGCREAAQFLMLSLNSLCGEHAGHRPKKDMNLSFLEEDILSTTAFSPQHSHHCVFSITPSMKILPISQNSVHWHLSMWDWNTDVTYSWKGRHPYPEFLQSTSLGPWGSSKVKAFQISLLCFLPPLSIIAGHRVLRVTVT